jgi:hypothetical protein
MVKENQINNYCKITAMKTERKNSHANSTLTNPDIASNNPVHTSSPRPHKETGQSPGLPNHRRERWLRRIE